MTPWVRRLLYINVAVFLVSPPPLGLMGILPPALLEQWVLLPLQIVTRPWTLLTYQFLHVGPIHLLFNMLGLFFFGPHLEARLGGRHFIGLYLISGVAGALLSVITAVLPIPGASDAAIVGASGSVFGIFLGFARYWPNERIYIWGIIPVPARILVIGLAIMSISMGFSGGGGIAHFAHLGGFIGGWIYLVLLERNSAARRFRRLVEPAAQPRAGAKDLSRWEEVELGRLHPLNREEFERLLAKARLLGPPALTTYERAFLERFSGS